MRKLVKNKRRSCGLCKPHKRGVEKRGKAKFRGLTIETDKEPGLKSWRILREQGIEARVTRRSSRSPAAYTEAQRSMLNAASLGALHKWAPHMKNNLLRVSKAAVLCVLPAIGYSGSAVERLSPGLRDLLGKEMRALQEGMKAIVPAYTSGNLEQVAHIAEKMKNSFILKQEITPEQKHELTSELPQSFLHLDQQFHEYAGMLKHVAQERRTELVGFYFYKLTESCVGCHTQFAPHKFPEFAGEKKELGHHH